MSTDNLISNFVEEQFPFLVREEGQALIQFVKSYYESVEQNNVLQNLADYRDIDNTNATYLTYIAKDIIPLIPKRVITDKTLLMKHIKDVYKARGAPIGYRIFFRALFNEEIDFYYPGDDILRASSGHWVEEVAIAMLDVIGNPLDIVGNRIVGSISGASAVVDRVEYKTFQGALQPYAFLQNIVSTFRSGEQIANIDNSVIFSISSSDSGPVQSVVVSADGGVFHQVGDTVIISSPGVGTGGQASVTATRADSAVAFSVANGGAGYSVNTSFDLGIISGGSGTRATFTVTEIIGPYQEINFYTDVIGNMAGIAIGTANSFIVAAANAVVMSSDDTIRLTQNFSDNDEVRFYYPRANTSDMGLVIGDTYYVRNANSSQFNITETIYGTVNSSLTADGTVNVTLTSANLAFANSDSVLSSVLGTAIANTGTIGGITTTDYGFGYYTGHPSATAYYAAIGEQYIADPINGGYYGRNAIINTEYQTGTIVTADVTLQGDRYESGESVTLINTDARVTVDAVAIASASSIIRYIGKYVDTNGWLSWDKKLQDNFYYQEFSYEIRSTQNINAYEKDATALLHPAGTKMFGQVQVHVAPDANTSSAKQIAVWHEIANTDLNMYYSQSNGAFYDTLTTNANSFALLAANDTITVSANSTTGYVRLPGTTGNWINTPDSAALSVTGDIDIRVHVALNDWTPVAASTLFAKYQGTFDRTIAFRVNINGTLNVLWSDWGGYWAPWNVSSTEAPVVTDGQAIWLRVTMDVDNGAAGNDITFYTSEDGVAWTQLGDIVTTAGTTSLFDGTALGEFGSVDNGTTGLLAGKFFRGLIYDGIDGTLVADFNPANQIGNSSWVSTAGETWTLTGSDIEVLPAPLGPEREVYTYVVHSLISSNSIYVAPDQTVVKLRSANDYTFTTSTITTNAGEFTFNAGYSNVAFGDAVYVWNALDPLNNGGPWAITNLTPDTITVTGYDACTTPFSVSVNDTQMILEVRRNYVVANNILGTSVNVIVDRYANTYAYSNSSIL